MKRCTGCETDKPLTEFYRDRQKSDGLMVRCKACSNATVQCFRDTEEGKKSLRATEAKYRATPQGRENRRIGASTGRSRYPDKAEARSVVSQAIRAGRLIPLPCARCGYPVSEAHHPDYNRPLEVIWLCRRHHVEAHQDCDDSSLR